MEASEQRHVCAEPITISTQSNGVTAPIADLEVTSVTAPTTALAGDSVTVSWTVQNNGPGTTNSNYWNDDIWLSNNTTLGIRAAPTFYLGTVQHTNPLAAGDSYSASDAVTVPPDLAAGNYYFIVVTDSRASSVYQTSYTNNATTTRADGNRRSPSLRCPTDRLEHHGAGHGDEQRHHAGGLDSHERRARRDGQCAHYRLCVPLV